MADTLYAPHARPLTVLYADLESHARGQSEVFVGTAGSVVERSNASGFRFYAHQFYGGDGRKRERYVAGPVGSPAADAAAAGLKERIRDLKERVPSLRLLGREGFSLVDARTYATLASLHNHRVFASGGVLVGSHAYGVLLNRLGVRAAPYATEDIDIARDAPLVLDRGPRVAFIDMLRGSGIEFVEVPAHDRKAPSTSFKQRGRSALHVDLLVPARGETVHATAMPELDAHAAALPYLGYLLAEAHLGLVLAREGCCTVRVPLPERFAIHKLVISRLRVGRDAKSGKDLLQASVLAAVLAESHPGALEAAVQCLPKRAFRHLDRALALLEPLLQAHPRAREELRGARPTSG